MNEKENSLRTLFLEAVEITDAAERVAYLQRACGDDAALRQRLDQLLKAHHDAGGFVGTGGGTNVILPVTGTPGGLSSSSPVRFGDYELLEEIARGGMGIVYKARQASLDRLVAVKTILAGASASKQFIHRFRTEASAAANLQHPNIVAVHEVGAHQGENYLVMDFVDGPNLAQVVGHKPLTARAAARYVRAIAEAIHYAHERGILHRDLKPSNVLIDSNDQPRVTDFGLAKRLDAEGDLTLSGQILGSPNFMSPEQAAGRRGKVSRRTDVHGLGAILYHALTARPPFQAGTLTETLQQVVHATPISPRLLNASVPRDFETITLKCLEKEPALRYHTAQELADELGRFLNGDLIVARPLGAIGKAWRWCWRKPALAAALAVAVVAAGAAGVFAFQAHKAEQQRLTDKRGHILERAMLSAHTGDLEGAENAVRAAELAGASLGEVRLLRGLVALHRGDFSGAIRELEQAAKLLPDNVAAQSLLAMAWSGMGNWQKAEPVILALKRLTPKTSEDFLFRGQLESTWDPAHGLELLNESIRMKPTVMSRLIRAQMRLNLAQLNADMAEAEGAMADASLVRELIPGNSLALSTSLLAHLVGASTYEEAGHVEKRAAALRQAAADAVALGAFRGNHEAVLARTWYFKFVADHDATLKELRQAAPELRNFRVDLAYAMALYQHGQFEEALRALDPDPARDESDEEIFRGYVLAELPGGPARAYAEFQRSWNRSHSPLVSLAHQTVLLCLGRKAEAVAASRKLREKGGSLSPWRGGWYDRLLDHYCDQLSVEDLLKAAGASRWNQCEAHFTIALTRLAEGDRAGARGHFQQAIATRVFNFLDYEWSQLFLARMEKDPAWPPWIPLKP